MHIAFRVDASTQIGTGHLMRCLTLADTAKQRGAQLRFVGRHMPEYLQRMIAARGYKFTLLQGAHDRVTDDLTHADWLGISQHADAQDSIQALSDQTWDWLVIDHYALDARWESALRQTAKNIFVIDDLADRQHDCDLLLDQNFYTDMQTRYIGKVPEHCQLMLGPRYALLREEFRQQREKLEPRKDHVKHILIFFGGMDTDNYTSRAIEALSNITLPDIEVDVVIGLQHPCRQQIESECIRHGFICHVQTERMPQLLATADLAIGAGGSAVWERCCLGLPTVTICAAENQYKQIADAASKGLLYAPELKDELVLVIERHLSALMENSYLRYAISCNGMQAVDGRGVLRVIGNLGCDAIEIRTAKHEDSENLFKWRNHPNIREASRNPDIINWEDHQKWFAAVLAAPDRVLLIGHIQGSPMGVVRFDVQGDEAEVSIYLVPDTKLSGQGRELLRSAERWFAAKRPEVSKLCAQVLGCNERSQYLFSEAGYQVELTFYSKRLH